MSLSMMESIQIKPCSTEGRVFLQWRSNGHDESVVIQREDAEYIVKAINEMKGKSIMTQDDAVKELNELNGIDVEIAHCEADDILRKQYR